MFIFLPLFLYSNSSSYTYTHTHSNFDPKLSPTIPLTTKISTVNTYTRPYIDPCIHCTYIFVLNTCMDANIHTLECTYICTYTSASTFWEGRGQSQKLFDNFSFYLTWGFLRMTLTTYRKRDLFESL